MQFIHLFTHIRSVPKNVTGPMLNTRIQRIVPALKNPTALLERQVYQVITC